MNLDFPHVNVECRCGVLLVSWAEVETHWRMHKDDREARRESQRRYMELVKEATSRRG